LIKLLVISVVLDPLPVIGKLIDKFLSCTTPVPNVIWKAMAIAVHLLLVVSDLLICESCGMCE
jgi:hypothetical protein